MLNPINAFYTLLLMAKVALVNCSLLYHDLPLSFPRPRYSDRGGLV
jgi:hypothetical protein